MPAMPATARVNVPITPPVFQDHYGRIRRRHRLRAALESGCAFSHDERDVLVCEAKA